MASHHARLRDSREDALGTPLTEKAIFTAENEAADAAFSLQLAFEESIGLYLPSLFTRPSAPLNSGVISHLKCRHKNLCWLSAWQEASFAT